MTPPPPDPARDRLAAAVVAAAARLAHLIDVKPTFARVRGGEVGADRALALKAAWEAYRDHERAQGRNPWPKDGA